MVTHLSCLSCSESSAWLFKIGDREQGTCCARCRSRNHVIDSSQQMVSFFHSTWPGQIRASNDGRFSYFTVTVDNDTGETVGFLKLLRSITCFD